MTDKRTYKQIIEELDNVISELQSENVDLDKVIELYKKGQSLTNALEQYIKRSENIVKEIKSKFNKIQPKFVMEGKCKEVNFSIFKNRIIIFNYP